MLYKNSIKVLFSNFVNVWKAILYFMLIVALSGFLIFLCINSIFKMLQDSGLFNDVATIYSDFLTNLNLTELFASIGEIINSVVDTIIRKFSDIWLSFFGIIFVILFLSVFISNLTIMPMCNSINYYMGSLVKNGYWNSFFDTFVKNLNIQFVAYFVTLPIKLLIGVFVYFSFSLFNYSWVISVLAVILLVGGYVLLSAFKYTLFATWIPTYVITDYSIFKSLKLSIKNVFKQFLRVYGCAVGVVLTIICLNFFLGMFTLLVGLLVSIPMSYLLYSSFGMVTAYECQGMRYYVDVYNVITPMKKEMKDKLEDLKFVV